MRPLDRDELTRVYAALGVDPDAAEEAVDAELDEGDPHLAMAAVCLSVWRYADAWRDDLSWIDRATQGVRHMAGASASVLERAMDAGLTREDLGEVARAVAIDHSFLVLSLLDEQQAFTLQEASGVELPGWVVEEVDPNGERTGRLMDGLAENFFSWDPSGDAAAAATDTAADPDAWPTDLWKEE